LPFDPAIIAASTDRSSTAGENEAGQVDSRAAVETGDDEDDGRGACLEASRKLRTRRERGT
jgi:hypothetical protein